MDLFIIYNGFQTLSDLVIWNLVPHDRHEEDRRYTRKDNILKTEWISIFPAINTVKINTESAQYIFKFRLDALLGSMTAMPRSVHTVIVVDGGDWVPNEFGDWSSTLFAKSGWNAVYKAQKNALVITDD